MNIFLVLVLTGVTIAQQIPSSSYGAPNGFRAVNGNGSPPSESYGAPSERLNNGFNGFNGNGAPNGQARNGFNSFNGNGGLPSRSYGAPSGRSGVNPEIASLTESIPGGGVPGEDYPVLASVPETDFSCDDQNTAGYYADTNGEAGCQVFHICQDRPNGRRQQDSFLCPNGTIFNQQYLVCDWWFNFDCADAESFYSVNELIGVEPYGYGNGNGNANANNGYGSNGNGNGHRNGNGNNGYGSNGNGNSGYSSNGNRNGKRNGNGKKNGNGNANSYGSNGNGASGAQSEIYGPPAAPSNGYGAPAAPSNGYGAPAAPSNGYGAPSNSYGAPF